MLTNLCYISNLSLAKKFEGLPAGLLQVWKPQQLLEVTPLHWHLTVTVLWVLSMFLNKEGLGHEASLEITKETSFV